MSNNQHQQVAQEYAKLILEKKLKLNEALQRIENSIYASSKQKIKQEDVVSILKLLKKELELSGEITTKKSFVSDDYNSLISQLNQIAMEIENSNN